MAKTRRRGDADVDRGPPVVFSGLGPGGVETGLSGRRTIDEEDPFDEFEAGVYLFISIVYHDLYHVYTSIFI